MATLKSLRLTCRELARMGNINRALFKSINLHPTEDNFQQLVQTDLTPIRPFVRQLNFFPSPYIPGLTRNKFEDMLRAHYSLLGSHCNCCARRTYEQRMHEHPHGRIPLSDREITARFLSYTQAAHEDMALLQDGILPDLWRKEILPLGNVSSIRLCSVTTLLSRQPYLINEPELSWCQLCKDNISFMDSIAGPNGDRLFEAVIRTLISTQLSIEELKVGCELEHTFQPGWSDSSWRQLNLDKLKTITIDSVPFCDRSESDFVRSSSATRACTAVIKKVQKTVQSMTLCRDYDGLPDLIWPPDSQLELLPMRSVHLKGFNLHHEDFADTIIGLTRLDKLVLERCDTRNWRTIFDAVSSKPTPLDFKCIDIYDDMDYWNFDMKKKDEVEAHPDVNAGTLLQKRLYLYLTHREAWNDDLELWFAP